MQPKDNRPTPDEIAQFDQMKATAMEKIRDSDSFFLVVWDPDDVTLTHVLRCVKKRDLRKLAGALNDTLSELIDVMNPIQLFMFVTQLREDMGL